MVPKIMKQGTLTPWFYLSAALLIMLLFIVYPTIRTVTLSLKDKRGIQPATVNCEPGERCWGVLENYRYALTNPEMLQALRNNALWILLMVPGTVGAGLVFAVLTDRVRYERLA
jgi:alpha-glucoside transport system permease protein